MTHRYCFALDLKDDPQSIAEYREHHREIWPEIARSIKDAGVDNMEIYLTGNRLLMILEAGPAFSLELKAKADLSNTKVQEWEHLMSRYQQPLPHARAGEKWLLMERIFKLEAS
jgi:L-rhamnose mutarotase